MVKGLKAAHRLTGSGDVLFGFVVNGSSSRFSGLRGGLRGGGGERTVGRRKMVFRSEEVCLAQLFLQSGSEYDCISELGELGLVEFRDVSREADAAHTRFPSACVNSATRLNSLVLGCVCFVVPKAD